MSDRVWNFTTYAVCGEVIKPHSTSQGFPDRNRSAMQRTLKEAGSTALGFKRQS
ncbi:MAG: hypothetical protein WAW61_13360 [Methylococcaceae bacterium]